MEWVLEQQAVDDNFSNKIFFSNVAHLKFIGYINKVIEERPLYPETVTVCCALWSGGVIGPYFFENGDGTTVI